MSKLKSSSLVPLILSALIAVASGWLALGSEGIYCDRLPAMTICATLAAFVIALCFKQMGREDGMRWVLIAAVLIAAATLFADARFVLKYRGLCSQLQEQIRQMQPHSK